MKKSSQRPLPPGIPCVSKKCSVPHPYVGITQIRWGRGNHPPLSPLSENSLADRLHVFPVQDHGKNTASRHGAWSGQGACWLVGMPVETKWNIINRLCFMYFTNLERFVSNSQNWRIIEESWNIYTVIDTMATLPNFWLSFWWGRQKATCFL